MKYLIIGNGVAGTTAAEHIRRLDKEGDITILTDEEYPFYSRIRLIDFLAGTLKIDDLILRSTAWYTDRNLRLVLNTPVKDIDTTKKEVLSLSDKRYSYDRLLLATGGNSFLPPISGREKEGVFAQRTLKDSLEILGYAGKGKKCIAMIGGGVLGLEAGNSLRKAGNSIAVIEFFPRLLPRQMDPEGARILQSQMENMGFTFYLGAKTKELAGHGKVESVFLEDGTRIECDMVIISAGVRPNAVLAEKLGLKREKGVLVNDRMETELPDIYAAGDLIQHRGAFYGIWPAAEKQGEVAGINMAGGDAFYEGTTLSNLLKVAGIDLFAAGDIDAEGKHDSIVSKDEKNYIYKKLVIHENTIIGAILYGDMENMTTLLKAIENKTDISHVRGDFEQWNLEGLQKILLST